MVAQHTRTARVRLFLATVAPPHRARRYYLHVVRQVTNRDLYIQCPGPAEDGWDVRVCLSLVEWTLFAGYRCRISLMRL